MPERPLPAAVGLALGLCALFVTSAARAEDPWLGRDKALHFGVSAGLGASGYGAAALVLDERWARAASAAAFSLSLGVAKELHDGAGHGTASWKDLTWDAAGTAVGVGLALALDLLLSSGDRREGARPNVASTQASGLTLRF